MSAKPSETKPALFTTEMIIHLRRQEYLDAVTKYFQTTTSVIEANSPAKLDYENALDEAFRRIMDEMRAILVDPEHKPIATTEPFDFSHQLRKEDCRHALLKLFKAIKQDLLAKQPTMTDADSTTQTVESIMEETETRMLK